MGVVLLLVLIWAMVLVPPALRSHADRKKAFLLTFSESPPPAVAPTVVSRSYRVQRRRRIAGGLLVAMAATLILGLLPSFRVLLIVHLFLVDFFLAYIALLAHLARRTGEGRPAIEAVPMSAPVEAPEPSARRWRTRVAPGPAVLG